ncbi:phospholipase D-like domain-containing protein [Agaribacterium haliotis]|uniref:phospholipase D-like domain-containing protein n=1 Tax=Agaribacterium haliotis TaxID=2013869 RepID=UPI000BB59B19|nr:phospholipase D-like domain-containing protein [Agaribacterium haliotis]
MSIYKLVTLIVLIISCGVLIGGCASINHSSFRTQSYSVKPDTTKQSYFGQIHSDVMQDKAASLSAFRLLDDGVEALAARLLLIEKAEHSIDAQYYLIKDDLAGQAFAHALIKAADRGVKVRILLDDFLSAGLDDAIIAMNAHPNIELRIYNPFAYRNFRLMDLHNFSQLNRRMHNKALISDNQVTIIGGRNIASEYFGARKDLNFGDLDVLAFGPIVQQTSQMFDDYWNAWAAHTTSSFTNTAYANDKLKKIRANLDKILSHAEGSIYADAVQQDFNLLLAEGNEQIYWADYQFLSDSPDKTSTDKQRNQHSIAVKLSAATRD